MRVNEYKELNPEMYPETIEKVISKGSTPAGKRSSRRETRTGA